MLWQNNNGAIYCAQHGGGYLRAAIQQSPKKNTHTTPRETWVAVKESDAHHGCETCNPNWWKK